MAYAISRGPRGRRGMSAVDRQATARHDVFMGERLEGTVALVTGASSGIGEATARSSPPQGARVAIVARRRDRLDELARRLEADGADGAGRSRPTSPTSSRRAARSSATVDELGRLDTVVNNAGVMLLGPIEDAPLEEWQRMVDLNVLGLLYFAHAALPAPARRRRVRPAPGRRPREHQLGRRPRRPRSGSGVYNLTKHGVGAFSESLRQEVTKRHVRVSLVEPGAVATELAGHNRPEVRETIATRFARHRADGGRRHRRRDRLHRHPPAPRRDQRGPHPPDRAGRVATTCCRRWVCGAIASAAARTSRSRR